ncbi:MAG: SufE family protein [Cyclobacteriaceae bacterium]|nr:SufE family protein [Cyclobacteriaceae bacterium]MCK5208690.1 SufE family protein [Cyclobacteriaceae bacterium]MCK5277412.1 SufE family protein [Cyclobacteriaceae bacterium]MCK5469959.1 SufE family protein [Cyclobacteriaceae bacterium]
MEIKENASTSMTDIQNEIIDEFSFLGDDRESTIFYIMELGQKLPELDEKYKIEENIIKGCQSKVWLTADLDGNRILFNADSNTDITKGLISLLIRVLSGQTVDDVLNTDLYFIEKIGMGQIIGSQRSNGLVAMIKQMKLYALAYKSKLS